MALWQFLALTCLIVALLVYVGVLTAMVRLANRQLRKVAESLQHLSVVERHPAVTAGDTTSRSGNYLTLRDLRAQQKSAASPTGPGPLSALSPAGRTEESIRTDSPAGTDKSTTVSSRINIARRRTRGAEQAVDGYVPAYLRDDLSPDMTGPAPPTEPQASESSIVAETQVLDSQAVTVEAVRIATLPAEADTAMEQSAAEELRPDGEPLQDAQAMEQQHDALLFNAYQGRQRRAGGG